MTREIPNIWISSPAVAEAFRIINEIEPSQFDNAWGRVVQALEVLPQYANQGSQKTGLATTKAQGMQPGMMDDIKAVMRKWVINSVPGLTFGDREEDKAVREARLEADLEVVRSLFERTYGVRISVENQR